MRQRYFRTKNWKILGVQEKQSAHMLGEIYYIYNDGHNILRFYDTITIFFHHTKRSVIISNKHGIYELPHELPNHLRLIFLGN